MVNDGVFMTHGGYPIYMDQMGCTMIHDDYENLGDWLIIYGYYNGLYNGE